MNQGMRSRTAVLHRTLAALALGAVLGGCGGGGGGGSPAEAVATSASDAAAMAGKLTEAAARPVAQPRNTEGRLLASNCFQCHGTLGTGGFEAIRGKEAGEVLEYLRKPAAKDIMAAHAQGYTPAQLQKVIAYLQQ